MSECLAVLLGRVDLDPPRFSGDEVMRWPRDTHETLVDLGLLRRVASATSIDCDACGDRHIEDVVTVVSPAGSGARAYIPCPEAGRVQVDDSLLDSSFKGGSGFGHGVFSFQRSSMCNSAVLRSSYWTT